MLAITLKKYIAYSALSIQHQKSKFIKICLLLFTVALIQLSLIVVVVINESLNVSLHLIILSTERLLLPTTLICNRLNLTANPVLLTDKIIYTIITSLIQATCTHL